jgi:hypothetical protein
VETGDGIAEEEGGSAADPGAAAGTTRTAKAATPDATRPARLAVTACSSPACRSGPRAG